MNENTESFVARRKYNVGVLKTKIPNVNVHEGSRGAYERKQNIDRPSSVEDGPIGQRENHCTAHSPPVTPKGFDKRAPPHDRRYSKAGKQKLRAGTIAERPGRHVRADKGRIKRAKERRRRLKWRKDHRIEPIDVRHIDFSTGNRDREMQRLVQVTFVLLTILCSTWEASAAASQCKTVVMDILMKKCRLGPRIKRSTDRNDIDKSIEELPIIKKIDITEQTVPRFRILQKRQTSYEETDMEGHSSTEDREFYDYYETDPSSTGEFDAPWRNGYKNAPLFRRFFGQEEPPSTSEHDSTAISALRASVSGSLLGFDMSTEEMDDLYNSLSERIPRGSKEEAWKLFLHTAAKCCQNIELCIKDARQIPCIGF